MERIEKWFFVDGDARQVAVLRLGLCAILVWRLATLPFKDLAEQPASLYRPVSFMRLLDHMPSASVVDVALPIAFLATICAGVGLASKFTLPLSWVMSVFLIGMTTSTGKIVHNDVLVLLCMVPLLIGTNDDAWSLGRRSSILARSRDDSRVSEPSWQYGWPVHTALLVVAGAYFFSGLAKIEHSGIAWAWSDNLRWILYANSDGRSAPNLAAVFIADHRWLSRFSACGILGTELFFPLVLWKQSLAFVFVPAVLALHALTYVTLGLNYLPMALAVVVVMAAVALPRLAKSSLRYTE